MNRTDLQTLCDLRAKEAQLLLDSRCFEGAYYLLGYAVECALKACIAKQVREHDFPDRKLVNDSYTHDLEKLLHVSGLQAEFRTEVAINPALEVNWTIARGWSEEARYSVRRAEEEVRNFFVAILGEQSGVFPWLKKYW